MNPVELNEPQPPEPPSDESVNMHEHQTVPVLDRDISIQEVRLALARAKNGKAMGFDEIPVEVMRNEHAIQCLHRLFNFCFHNGIIPEMWTRGIINPIPKSSSADDRDPLSYRGITLASCIYKLYVGVLNKRLTTWAEGNKKLHDNQNGFRQGRSCGDHLSTLSQLIDSRKKKNLSTNVAFNDFSKAYDRISRSLLWNKLNNMGVSNKFLTALQSLYTDVKCCVNVNGHKSDWFPVSVGLKQGCLISPLLFNLYINDLVDEIKSLKCGVDIDEEDNIDILLYADDIALIAKSESDLQKMLDKLSVWCNKWKLKVNPNKSQVVHFRKGPSVARTMFTFVCGDDNLNVVDSYRYLGLIFTEFLDFTVMSKAVAQSATRALGLVIAKCKAHGGVPHSVFTQLYDALVQPIIDYGASVWGTTAYSHIKTIQYRAGRFFLGLGKYAPNTAVSGEMGWKDPEERLWKCVFRQWHRLSSMLPNRLNARVHKWSKSLALHGTKNIAHKTITFARSINVWDDTTNNLSDLPVTYYVLTNHFVSNWKSDLNRQFARRGQGRNKLRTYNTFKSEFGTAEYVKNVYLTRAQRSALAKFRCGVAPIRLETGRYEGLPEGERICPMCDSEDIESEIHVLTKCSLYSDLRTELYNQASQIQNDFNILTDNQKFVFIVNNVNIIKCAAKTCHAILNRRRTLLYI